MATSEISLPKTHSERIYGLRLRGGWRIADISAWAVIWPICLGAFFLLSACNLVPSQPTQAPQEYLDNALDWIETHAVLKDRVDWEQMRQEAMELASGAQTTAETYTAVEHVLRALCLAGDRYAFLFKPETAISGKIAGYLSNYPDGVIVQVMPGSPAEHAGIQVGDVVVAQDDKPYGEVGNPCVAYPGGEGQKIVVNRRGVKDPLVFQLNYVTVDLPKPVGRRLDSPWEKIGYLELTTEAGTDTSYPTQVQSILRSVDQSSMCGWIIDLRRINGGDIWTYLAGVGPLLGEGELGGFDYLDGSRDTWAYRDGKVYWGNVESGWGYVRGGIYQPRNSTPAIALLINGTTHAAGELVGVAFSGRPDVHFFGEPTFGNPFLTEHTALSDGAEIYLSGARSYDRLGKVYSGPLIPDETIATDWTKFGSNQDPLIGAAANWLQTNPVCVTQEDKN